MTCNANKNTYKSVGNIHIRVGEQPKLLFTPNAEHSASDGDKKYAVFLPTCSTDGVATALCGPQKSVPISVCCFGNLSVLVAAAAQQTVVEIEVTKESAWTLKSITIPVPRTKK